MTDRYQLTPSLLLLYNTATTSQLIHTEQLSNNSDYLLTIDYWLL